MSAREELIESLTRGVVQSSEFANLLIDNLLEEEAEKIRDEMTDKYALLLSDFDAGLSRASEIIGPYPDNPCAEVSTRMLPRDKGE